VKQNPGLSPNMALHFSRFVCENAKLDSADRSYRVTRRGEQWPQGVKTQRLKKEVRKDVDDHSRRRLWLTVTTAGALLEKQPNFYSEILQDMFGEWAHGYL
jgi:hypothetical protein